MAQITFRKGFSTPEQAIATTVGELANKQGVPTWPATVNGTPVPPSYQLRDGEVVQFNHAVKNGQ